MLITSIMETQKYSCKQIHLVIEGQQSQHDNILLTDTHTAYSNISGEPGGQRYTRRSQQKNNTIKGNCLTYENNSKLP